MDYHAEAFGRADGSYRTLNFSPSQTLAPSKGLKQIKRLLPDGELLSRPLLKEEHIHLYSCCFSSSSSLLHSTILLPAFNSIHFWGWCVFSCHNQMSNTFIANSKKCGYSWSTARFISYSAALLLKELIWLNTFPPHLDSIFIVILTVKMEKKMKL